MQAPCYYQHCLQEELDRRCEKNPRYSLRAFARATHLDVGALSLVFSGKRAPSYSMTQKLIEALGLSPEERQQFLTSVAQAHQERGSQRLSPALKMATKTKRALQQITSRELTPDLFRVIADWYHYAILELTYTKNFRPDVRFIAAELGIGEAQCKLAVQRLFRLGLLEKSETTWVKADAQITTADKHLTTAALKKSQLQNLQNALHSIENDSIDERSNTSMVMAIDESRLPEAKKMILEFNRKLCAFLEGGPRTRVYTLCVGLNPNQRKKKEKSV